MAWFPRIRHRMIVFFVFFVAAVLLLSAWLLRWTIVRGLEEELGKKLTAVAEAAAVLLDENTTGIPIPQAGDRTRAWLTGRLQQLKNQTRLDRIYVFTWSGKSLLDTDTTVTSGSVYPHLRFHIRELSVLQTGGSAHSILFFEEESGRPFMTGFAPLLRDSIPAAGIGVEGGVTFLQAIHTLRDRLLLVGLTGILTAILLGIIMARSITGPLQKLEHFSLAISKGKMDQPAPDLGQTEIGMLARTMETMRQSILQRERELKAMVAGIAHEIRNPLGGIELFSGLLADEIPGGARPHLERINKEIGQLKTIVNHFLEFAKPSPPQPEICFVEETIRETLELLKEPLQRQSIHVEWRGDPSWPPVPADPAHLKQIFLNLLLNSLQAMPSGGGLIFTGWKKQGKLILELTDKGKGIPEKEQDQIFTPFFTTREQGTGLGLAIVRSLMESNGGHIRLVRSDTRGTTFELSFPVNEPDL